MHETRYCVTNPLAPDNHSIFLVTTVAMHFKNITHLEYFIQSALNLGPNQRPWLFFKNESRLYITITSDVDLKHTWKNIHEIKLLALYFHSTERLLKSHISFSILVYWSFFFLETEKKVKSNETQFSFILEGIIKCKSFEKWEKKFYRRKRKRKAKDTFHYS